MKLNNVKWSIFTIIAIGNFLGMLDSTIVNLALYPMARDLGVNISQVQWVIIAYTLVLTVFLPFWGKIGDIVPKNKLYATGFALFACGSFLNSLAQNLPMLIVFRCVEALGASIVISNASSVIASLFKGKDRGKALGLNGCLVAVGGLLGPSLGGILMQIFNWHAIFLPSVPIALFGVYYSYKMVPSNIAQKEKLKFDYPGFIYFTISLFALLLAISEGYHWGWGSIKIISLGIICLGFGFLFYYRDHRISYPMINFNLFSIKPFTFGNLAVMMSYMAMFTNTILLPFYLQDILKFKPFITALIILPYSIVLMITAPLSGSAAGKYGSRYLTLAGPIVTFVALSLFILFDEKTPVFYIMLLSGVMGLGNGLFQSPSNTAIISSVDKDQLGIASGILALSRNMGNILGVAITITLFASFRDIFEGLGLSYNISFLKAYRYTMAFGMFFAFLCVMLSFFAYRDNNGVVKRKK